MNKYDTELLRRIEGLIRSFQRVVRDAEGDENYNSLMYGLRAIVMLANMVLKERDVFGLEPWHVLSDGSVLSEPGEMLLRLKDSEGNAMPPYPAIMAFYENGYTTDIDSILFLAALAQFERSKDRQVSINVSARSFRDAGFVKCTLERLEALHLNSDKRVIIEIHESSPHLTMSRRVLELYRNLDVEFAVDDVGLNINDIMRLAEFDQLVDYIKIDRHAVCAPEGSSNSLGQVAAFVRSLMPGVVMVAEGVQDAAHALALQNRYSDIIYVQGLYLPEERKEFKTEMHNERLKGGALSSQS